MKPIKDGKIQVFYSLYVFIMSYKQLDFAPDHFKLTCKYTQV